MNQVPAVIRNPAHIEEPESDEEVVADGAEGGRGEK